MKNRLEVGTKFQDAVMQPTITLMLVIAILIVCESCAVLGFQLAYLFEYLAFRVFVVVVVDLSFKLTAFLTEITIGVCNESVLENATCVFRRALTT